MVGAVGEAAGRGGGGQDQRCSPSPDPAGQRGPQGAAKVKKRLSFDFLLKRIEAAFEKPISTANVFNKIHKSKICRNEEINPNGTINEENDLTM